MGHNYIGVDLGDLKKHPKKYPAVPTSAKARMAWTNILKVHAITFFEGPKQ